MEGGTRLDFNSCEFATVLGNDIHFVAVAIPEEIEIGCLALVIAGLQTLDHNEILEDVAHKWISRDLVRLLNAEKINQEPHVHKVVFEIDYAGMCACRLFLEIITKSIWPAK